MDYRTLGKTGVKVSAIGLGCNNFGLRSDAAQTKAVVDRALELGVNFIDTADRYGEPAGTSEQFVGRALGARRKDVVLASKFGNPMDDSGTMQGGSRRYIRVAVEASLKRLGTDWIDLYQIHRPDPDTPIAETLAALEELVREGKIRHYGCSQFSAGQLLAAHAAARQAGFAGFTTIQHHYNLLARDKERDLLPAIREAGVAFIPFYPLAGGMLTGKYRRDAAPEGSRFHKPRERDKRAMGDNPWPVLEKLEKFCASRNRPMLELAVNWLLAKPEVATVIAGATRPAQVGQNVQAVGWKLTAADLAEIDRITA